MEGLEVEVIEAMREIKIDQLKEIRRSWYNDKYKIPSRRMLIRITTLENLLLTVLATKCGYKVFRAVVFII